MVVLVVLLEDALYGLSGVKGVGGELVRDHYAEVTLLGVCVQSKCADIFG